MSLPFSLFFPDAEGDADTLIAGIDIDTGKDVTTSTYYTVVGTRITRCESGKGKGRGPVRIDIVINIQAVEE